MSGMVMHMTNISLGDRVNAAIEEHLRETNNSGMVVSFALCGEFIDKDGQEVLFHTAPSQQSWLTTSTLVSWFHRMCNGHVDRILRLGENLD